MSQPGGGGGGVLCQAMFFQLLSAELKLVNKIMQSTYLCVILQIRHKKSILAVFTWLLILG